MTDTPTPDPRPKIRAEFTAFSASDRSPVAALTVYALGGGPFVFKIWDMRSGPMMEFGFTDGSRYVGPLWRSVDDMSRAVAKMTAELLAEGSER